MFIQTEHILHLHFTFLKLNECKALCLRDVLLWEQRHKDLSTVSNISIHFFNITGLYRLYFSNIASIMRHRGFIVWRNTCTLQSQWSNKSIKNLECRTENIRGCYNYIPSGCRLYYIDQIELGWDIFGSQYIRCLACIKRNNFRFLPLKCNLNIDYLRSWAKVFEDICLLFKVIKYFCAALVINFYLSVSLAQLSSWSGTCLTF